MLINHECNIYRKKDTNVRPEYLRKIKDSNIDNLPYSEACERNSVHIFNNLKKYLIKIENVLEIGSGTAQHAIYFGTKLPRTNWQTSDLKENHDGIIRRIKINMLNNVKLPLFLDVNTSDWHELNFPAVYTSNTLHIMSLKSVKNMFIGLNKIISKGGKLFIYGPFKYKRSFVSDSDKIFDEKIKIINPDMGIRDFESVCAIANDVKIDFEHQYNLPANNKLLVFKKSEE